MKLLVMFLFYLLPFIASASSASNICPVNADIAEDMRIPESHFTKDRAIQASELLSEIINGKEVAYNSFNVFNAQKLVTGYILKTRASETSSADIEFRIREFCSFMEDSAWWYD